MNQFYAFYNFFMLDNLLFYDFSRTKLENIDCVKVLGYVFILKCGYDFYNTSKLLVWKRVKKLSIVNDKINEKRREIIEQIKEDFKTETYGLKLKPKLPENGIHIDNIDEEFQNMITKRSIDFKKGRMSGATYSKNDELDKVLAQLFKYFNKSNPLHTNLFPAIRKMENECISSMIDLFNGNVDTCGVFTSGGTESILMACKTYRDLARKQGIKNPEILTSTTVHCAFNKACQYFDIKLIQIPCLKNGRINMVALLKSISDNTILLVGSTPSYNLGIIDQIPELSKLALEYSIYLHVDACIGSFLVNFTDLKYDFSLSGVSSISADFHKYGQTPKGASCIMYKNKDIMKHQYYVDVDWSGGVYASSAMAGSRCGNVVALCWATLMFYGKNGYLKNYRKIKEMNEHLKFRLLEVKEIFIYGVPRLSIVALGSDKININLLAEKLKGRGWSVSVIQNPTGFHFCITSYHTKEIVDNFVNEMKNIISNEDLKKSNTSPCIYGTMKKVNDPTIIKSVVSDYLHCVNGVNL